MIKFWLNMTQIDLKGIVKNHTYSSDRLRLEHYIYLLGDKYNPIVRDLLIDRPSDIKVDMNFLNKGLYLETLDFLK